jgi:hypothetical protein
MTIFSSKTRPYWIAAAMIAVAAYLYYSHLSGLSAPNSDENRVYHWNPFTPILYFICRPFTHFFRDQDAPYYVMATMGMVNLGLIFYLGRIFLSSGAAWWAAAFYLVNDYALSYSRLLYYSTPLVLMTLVAMAAYAVFQRRGGWQWFALSAAMSGVMFYTNPSAYAIIAALLAWALWVEFSGALGPRRRPFWAQIILFPAAALAAYAACEVYSFWLVAHRPGIAYVPQWKNLFSYHEINAAEGTGPRYLATVLIQVWKQTIAQNVSQAVRCAILAATALGAVGWAWRKRDWRLMAFAVFGFGGMAVILAGVAAKVHGLYPRNLLWIVPPLAMGFGYAVDALLRARLRTVRGACAVLLVVYFSLAGAQAWAIPRAFFSVDSINHYLAERDIPKTKVMTLFQINRYEDFASRKTTVDVPMIRTYKTEDNAKNLYYYIHWPMVLKIFQAGRAEYFLSSSIGHIANVGVDDILLNQTVPLKIWENHPLNNPFVPMSLTERPGPYQIKLYALKDIFSTAQRLSRSAQTRPAPEETAP